MRHRHVELRVMEGPRTTIAEFDVPSETGIITFTGDSKKHPKDVDNPEIGEAYAISRALQKASDAYRDLADWRLAQAEAEASPMSFTVETIAGIFENISPHVHG